MKASIKIKN